MNISHKKILKIVGIVVAALIVIALAIPLFVNVNNYRPQIESRLSSTLGRPVKVGNLSLSILTGSVEADQLSIADDPKFSSTPFLQAKTLKVGVELLPLIFSKSLDVTHLKIEQPQISLLRDRDGIWNFSSLGNHAGQSAATQKPSTAASSNETISVDKLDVTDGTVTLGSTTGKRKPIVYDKASLTMRSFSFTSSFPVTASIELPGGGSVKIDGMAGPINSTDTSRTPVQAKVTIRKLDLSQSALVDPSLGAAGSADFDGSVTSDGNIAKANGTLKATSLKIVPKGSPATVPVQVVFSVEHDLKQVSGKVVQADVTIGKALAKLTGTYDMHGETTAIHTKLAGQGMPVDDLEGVLPAVGVVLPSGSKLKGGTVSVELNSNGPLDKLVSTGWVKMSNSELTGFNLGSKLSALSSLTGKQVGTGNDTKIENLSSDVRYSPDGTRLDKIDAVIPSLGTVTGAGTISPSNALDFKMIANLSGIGAGLSKTLGAGSGGIPVDVGGTMSNPTFMPDMKGVAGGKVKELVKGGKSVGGLGGLLGKKPH
ncbi:MAG TPA: AsmA family protein [Terriglobales bacterium]|jgi:AsmA protein|nr:AsmA family protein [Terriglobales bacterium]